MSIRTDPSIIYKHSIYHVYGATLSSSVMTGYRAILQHELDKRKDANPAYSMRAYARDLGISSSRLSEILTAKGGLSPLMAAKIASKLGYSKDEAEYFSALVMFEKPDATAAQRRRAKSRISFFLKTKKNFVLEQCIFEDISEWYYYAILMVMNLDEFDGTTPWIAHRLGLDQSLAESAVERLIQLELIQKKSRGLVPTGKNIQTTSDISLESLRKSHRQNIDQARESLETVPVNERDISSVTMAIDKDKMPEAKKLIRDFRRKLAIYLESGRKNSVYNLNIQLYPVTKV